MGEKGEGNGGKGGGNWEWGTPLSTPSFRVNRAWLQNTTVQQSRKTSRCCTKENGFSSHSHHAVSAKPILKYRFIASWLILLPPSIFRKSRGMVFHLIFKVTRQTAKTFNAVLNKGIQLSRKDVICLSVHVPI